MPNQLVKEFSPYLKQHANNPVDWYAWGEEAFELARSAEKPILLSIGYSACHWCHVMAYECFEDMQVAAVMNRLFINIKVDREERPEIDHIYQSAHQILQQRPGGWPLTVFMSPEGMPFYCGTYFPKIPRQGLPGFLDLLESIATYWAKHKGEIDEQNHKLAEAMQKMVPQLTQEQEEFDISPIARAAVTLGKSFDRRWGGFGDAPKFPRCTDLALLLRSKLPEQRQMALFSLAAMGGGGIFDQLGGGFFRYSVDSQWSIPHFEKMLYDNGALLALYAEAAALTGQEQYSTTANMLATWAVREMQLANGGFCASLDADAAGGEGRYYMWLNNDVGKLLSAREYAVASAHWGLNLPASYQDSLWHLQIVRTLPDVSRINKFDLEETGKLLDSARQKMLAAREKRPNPMRDSKILVSWNALMIEGLLRAGRLLEKEEWVLAGRRALDFIRSSMWVKSPDDRKSGRLLAWGISESDEFKAQGMATLDDYAFLLAACIESLQVGELRVEDMQFAHQLAEAMLERFENQDGGGFYLTEHDHEQLIHRPMVGHDASIPSGNGVGAWAMQRLGVLCGEPGYLSAAERVLSRYYPVLKVSPSSFGSMFAALDEWIAPLRSVVLTGPAKEVRQWQLALTRRAAYGTIIIALPGDLAGKAPLALHALAKKEVGTEVKAWICEGMTCREPNTELEKVLELIALPRQAVKSGGSHN